MDRIREEEEKTKDVKRKEMHGRKEKEKGNG